MIEESKWIDIEFVVIVCDFECSRSFFIYMDIVDLVHLRMIYPPAKRTLLGDDPADVRWRGRTVPCRILWLNESRAADILKGHGAGPDVLNQPDG